MNKKIFLLVFALCFLVLPLVNAGIAELDNFLITSNGIGYGDYPHLEIQNFFGLGDTIWSGDITNHTNVCGPDCSSEFTVWIKDGKSLIDEIDFYTLQPDGKTWIEQDIRGYRISFYNKTHWDTYPLGYELEEGIYDIKLEAQKKPSRTVDWRITTEGKVLNDWAIWGNISDGDEAEVTLSNPLDDEIYYVSTVNFNCSANVINGATLTNLSLWGNFTGTWAQNQSVNLTEGIYTGFHFDISGQSDDGRGITTDGTNIWLTDINDDEVYKYDMDGNYINSWDTSVQSGDPHGITTDGTNIWINDVNDLEVYKYTMAGAYVNSFDTSGEGATTYGLTTDGTNIWTGESGGDEVYRYTMAGVFVDQFDTSGSGHHPGDLATDGTFMWVPEGNRLHKYTNAGVFVNTLDISAQVANTWGHTVNGSNIWVFDSPTKEIYKYTKGVTFNQSIITQTINNSINWSCRACDTDGACGFAETNRTVVMDTIFPGVTITSPTSPIGFQAINTNLTLFTNATDFNLDTCWYSYSGVNTSFTCNETTDIVIANYENRTLTFWANDSLNNVNSTSITWNYSVFANEYPTFDNVTYETATDSYNINISTDGLAVLISTLNYNGINYSATKSGNDYNITFISSVSHGVTSSGSKNFYWIFDYGGNASNSNTYTQEIRTLQFDQCNASLTVPYINFSFLDEETLLHVNATIDTSTWEYWVGDGTYTKSLVYSNLTEYSYYTFCLNASNTTLHNTRSVQYASAGYPQRKYVASSDLTNSSLNKTLYLLSSADGIYTTIQVIDEAINILSGVDITIERQFSGVWTIIGQETTDEAGSATFWVNPDYDHRFTFVKDGCAGTTIIIRPTQTQYTQQLICGATATATATIEGIKYARGPSTGMIDSGLTNFSYYIYSSKGNIAGASFMIMNSSNSTSLLNSTSSACAPGGCTLYFFYNVPLGADIKGRYYVDLGNGSILLEGDARWWSINISTAGKGGIGTLVQDMIYIFQEWGTDERGKDFNRLVTMFFLMCLVMSVMNLKFGNDDTMNPGAYMVVMTIFIWICSLIGNGSPTWEASHGLFYFSNLTSSGWINNYILALFCLTFTASYFFGANRRVNQ